MQNNDRLFAAIAVLSSIGSAVLIAFVVFSF